MLAEELGCVRITPKLHIAELQPGKVCIEVRRSHEGYMNAQVPVHGRAVDTNEDSIGDTGPCRVLGIAIKASLE